ncbi:MAG: hypothetical protein ACREFX_00055 [Opitutaceae bacterium]
MKRRWSTVDIAAAELDRCGIPADRLILAPVRDVRRDRTYMTALAAREALAEKGIAPRAIDVFTRGAHACRSRMVFEKVFAGRANVGVISWQPKGYEDGPWWDSSERTQDLIKETLGCLYEIVRGRGPRDVGGPPALDFSIHTGA